MITVESKFITNVHERPDVRSHVIGTLNVGEQVNLYQTCVRQGAVWGAIGNVGWFVIDSPVGLQTVRALNPHDKEILCTLLLAPRPVLSFVSRTEKGTSPGSVGTRP